MLDKPTALESLKTLPVSQRKAIHDDIRPGERCPIGVEFISDYTAGVWNRPPAEFFMYGRQHGTIGRSTVRRTALRSEDAIREPIPFHVQNVLLSGVACLAMALVCSAMN